MNIELKTFGLGIACLAFFYFYAVFLFAFDIKKEDCFIKKFDPGCMLISTNNKNCFSNNLKNNFCANIENMQTINCIIKSMKNINICKVYLTMNDMYDEIQQILFIDTI